MINEFLTAFNEIVEMRSLPQDVILEALQTALVTAYRRDTGASQAQRIEARIDPATGRARIFVEKEVTDQVITPETEVTLEKARFYNPEAELGDTVMVQIEHTTKKFGRIAAQTAKQVILQKIREAERKSLYDEFAAREGDLITGTVQSYNQNLVTLSLGRAEAILPRAQQIPGERYRQHDKLRVLLLEVKEQPKGPQIICSRSHRNMLRRLLEYEVPEIYNGQVEIKSIAREAGYRSKVAVAALQEGIDPVGACVGMRGIRIQNIVKELHDEKIDVIEWSQQPEVFISKALSPARVTGVYLEEDPIGGRTAVVVVPDDQLSLAIGREGQNARLAAKLTGWRIDIKSVSETVQGALENLDIPPFSELVVSHARLIEDVQRIIEKKEQNKAIMPEEFTTLGRFADLVEKRLLRQREEIRMAEREHVDAVKATLPPELFELPLTLLALPDEVLDVLEPLGNVGEVVLATLIDEGRLRDLIAEQPDDTMEQIRFVLDSLMEADMDFGEMLAEVEAEMAEAETEAAIEEAELLPDAEDLAEEPVADLEAEAVAGETVAAAVEPEALDEVVQDEAEEDVLIGAFGGERIRETDEPLVDLEGEEAEVVPDPDYDEFAVVDDLYEDDDDDSDRKDKKGRKKRRQLVFDEETGEVVAKRRRKSNRRGGRGWDDFDEF